MKNLSARHAVAPCIASERYDPPPRPRKGSRPLPDDIRVRFGNRISGLRDKKGWTQKEMAEKFGIDRSFLSDIERARKSISLPMCEVFALGFEISLSELLKGV